VPADGQAGRPAEFDGTGDDFAWGHCGFSEWCVLTASTVPGVGAGCNGRGGMLPTSSANSNGYEATLLRSTSCRFRHEQRKDRATKGRRDGGVTDRTLSLVYARGQTPGGGRGGRRLRALAHSRTAAKMNAPVL
jgi:hypothetical protein